MASAIYGESSGDNGGGGGGGGSRRQLPVRPILVSAPSQPAAPGHGDDGEAAKPLDDFELYCRMANSPASMGNSSPLHSPAGSVIAKVDDWIRSLAGQELERPDTNLLRVEQQLECGGSAAAAAAAASSAAACRINKYRSKSHRLRREREPAVTVAAVTAAAAAAAAAALPTKAEEASLNPAAMELVGEYRPRADSATSGRRRNQRHQEATTAAMGVSAAVPDAQADQTLVRVRSFRRTKRGLVNQGDATLVRGARSSCSLNSSAASNEQLQQFQQLQQHLLQPVDPRSVPSRRPSSADRSTQQPQTHLPPLPPQPAPPPPAALSPAAPLSPGGGVGGGCTRLGGCSRACRVQVMGASRVGKSALCAQFMSSESHVLSAAAEFGRSFEQDPCQQQSAERFVNVLLDGDEYHVTFLDTEGSELGMYIMDVDAYMIVFALDNRRSFVTAKQVLNELVSEARKASALILVGNKSDLVRNKEVPYEEAKNLAEVYGAMYMEVSTALNHQVDELLVGTLSQVRSQQRRMQKAKEKLISLERGAGSGGLRASLRIRSPRRMVGAFIKKHFSSRSCENLDKEA